MHAGRLGVGCLTISPDGRLVAVRANEGVLWVWDASTGKEVHVLQARDPLVWCLAFTPDGRTLAAGCGDGSVRQWEMATGKARVPLTGGGDMRCLAFAQGGRVVIAGDGQKLRFWDRLSGKVFHETESVGSVPCVAASADEQKLLAGSGDGTALVWDLANVLKQRRPLRSTELTDKDLDALWRDLGGDDGGKSWSAAGALAATPKQAVLLLKKRAPQAAPVDAERLDRLLADLDSDDFGVRDRASEELAGLGRKVETELRNALKKATAPEVRTRLSAVLARIEKEPPDKEGPALAARVVELLELIDVPEGRELLREWAKGEASAPLTKEAKAALKRLDDLPGKRP
jgi:hypothetical protein